MLESSVPEKLATAISSGIFFPSSLNLFIAPMANVSVKAKIALKGIFLSTNISAAFFPSSKVIPVFISILFLSKGIPNLAKASLYPLTRSMEL